MPSKPSLQSSPLYPSVSTSLIDVRTTTLRKQPAHTQSGSNDSPKSLSISCSHSSADSSSIRSGASRLPSTVDHEPSVSTSHPSDHDLYEALYDLPPSSTPDLLSPDAPSPSESPTAPLTQRTFADQLRARLQNVLDQQWNEHVSHVLDSASPHSPRSDFDSVETSQIYREEIHQGLTWTKSAHGDGTSSDISSESSWSISPRKHILFEGVYPEIPLTHRNKRKHDFSHGFLGSLNSDGETTDVNDGEPLPTRKKTKVRTGSTVSISTTFSYQTNETASSRKLRSLRSTTSSFSSADSTVVTSPLAFVHPIIHPPSNPPHPPNSRPDVAEARITQLLKREKSYRIQDGLPAGSFELPDVSSDSVSRNIFGIEPDFRRRVVEWILEVIPPRYLNSQEFYQHLKYSEETRFHAIYLFSRFFLRMAECNAHPGMLETKEMKAARVETTWDVAFCCLVISTKFYHDFLYPLSPIYSRHFLAIAPQVLGHDQFERIQRDVLEAFDYEIHGITPHAFFEELWDALPSLRELLRFRRTRVKTRDEMWDTLQLAALECDIMRYPVSLLTAAALIESVLITLVYEYEKEEKDRPVEQQSMRLKKNCCRARDEIRPVAEEVSRLLGTTVAELDACRHWLAAVTSEWTY